MGIQAGYLMVDEKTLSSFMELDNKSLCNRIEQLENDDKTISINIDKIWDALHCFLTGTTASEPIEGNKLSEAVVGIHVFNIEDENADFVGCIENEELESVIKSIEDLPFEKMVKKFDPIVLKNQQIYPKGIWQDSKEQLVDEFQNALTEIEQFYKKALETNKHIIVSIY